MAANWEFLGHYFEKPTTFCLLGAKRYTLELIREHQTYTMSFFPEQFNGDVFAFGAKSVRDSDKMKETKLTHVLTPSGGVRYSYKCMDQKITTSHDLPGTERPAEVKRIYDAEFDWLNW